MVVISNNKVIGVIIERSSAIRVGTKMIVKNGEARPWSLNSPLQKWCWR